jgi:hypothetical protein
MVAAREIALGCKQATTCRTVWYWNPDSDANAF